MDTQADNYITGDSAFAVDRDGVIVFWNEAAEKSFGFPSSAALGKKCWRLLSGEDDYGNRHCCKNCPIREMAFRHDPVHRFLSTFKTATDEPKKFAVTCVAILDDPDDELLLHICHSETDPVKIAIKPTSPGYHPGHMSEREIEILALLADKVSTSNIASNLSISIRTVRTHIQHLMYKLQVHNRRDAIKAGKRLKLI